MENYMHHVLIYSEMGGQHMYVRICVCIVGYLTQQWPAARSTVSRLHADR